MHPTATEYTREALPSWAGLATFLRAPVRDIHDLAEGMVAIAGVPHDTTNGARPGARYGPRAIRETSLHLAWYFQTAEAGSLVDVRTGQRIAPRKLEEALADVGDLNMYPNDIPRNMDSIRRGVAAILRQGAFPALLGGDHHITYPAFLGFADAMAERGAKRLGYIQVDAHLDLSDESPVFGLQYHGSNARRASEHELLDPANMAWIGTSGYVREDQWNWAHEQGCHIFTINDVRTEGAVPVVRKAIDRAAHDCDAVYLTIDIDCVGASYAPGTGSINIDGMTPRELLDMVDELSIAAPIGAFDLVEVAPQLDPAGVTERLAASVILNFLRPRLSVG